VVRTDLATTVLTAGTLGYAPTRPLVNRVTGTYTGLPAAGTHIGAGQDLYRIDNRPVVMMTGALPAWRDFTAGMTDGPDVGQLESNLIALGDAHGLFSTASDHFSALTTESVDRWQSAKGYLPTGQIPLGVVVFFPEPVLAGAAVVAPGQVAAPGDAPFPVTTAVRTVTVPLTPNDPAVPLGESVSVVLPSGSSTPGTVTAVGPVQSAGSGASPTSPALTVVPTDPAVTGTGSGVGIQVSLTIERVRHVLALPVSALLALAGGGYGVEVVSGSGAHRLIGVTTGIFAGGRVQVSGSGIVAGTKVVVAQ
jgi:hypothetical protein